MQFSIGNARNREIPAETRRGLLIGAIQAMWGFIGVVFGLPAFQYLLSPPKPKAQDEWVDIGEIAALPAGHPVEVVFYRSRIDAWKNSSEKLTAWVVRTSSSSFVAFGPQCTHLGCVHHWNDTKSGFVCPCHNSRFSIQGTVLGGPAARALDRYGVKIEGAKVLLGALKQSGQTA